MGTGTAGTESSLVQAGCVSQGAVRARRKPGAMSRSSGACGPRAAARASYPEAEAPPPRVTRAESASSPPRGRASSARNARLLLGSQGAKLSIQGADDDAVLHDGGYV